LKQKVQHLRPTAKESAVRVLRQAGVLAYRVKAGRLQILLLTSRETKRWIVPKGNIGAGSTALEAAAAEAFEEAGVVGDMTSLVPLGLDNYFKLLPSGARRPASVEIYLLKARKLRKKWPERSERKRVWVSVKKALEIIGEPSLAPLLLRLQQLEADLCTPE
jgi:8-oxo-dGTP pyrophosphatase MutT (NUDIX family)